MQFLQPRPDSSSCAAVHGGQRVHSALCFCESVAHGTPPVARSAKELVKPRMIVRILSGANTPPHKPKRTFPAAIPFRSVSPAKTTQIPCRSTKIGRLRRICRQKKKKKENTTLPRPRSTWSADTASWGLCFFVLLRKLIELGR